MAKLLTIMLVSLSISTNVLLGKDACSHYDEKACVDPNITKHGHYVNQWTVATTGMAKEDVKHLIENNSFVFLGQIIDGADLYLVTNTGTPEKHAMPDQRSIEQLMKLENVDSVEQIHMFDDKTDAVFSMQEVYDVVFQHLNPDEIVLNDGSENLKRIMSAMNGGEDKDPSALQFSLTRPVSNNVYNSDNQDDETIVLPDYEDQIYIPEDNPI